MRTTKANLPFSKQIQSDIMSTAKEIQIKAETYRRIMLRDRNSEYKDILYQVKNNGEFGYYLTTGMHNIVELLSFYESKSFLDLGAGVGLLLQGLRHIYPALIVKGYENEDLFIADSELFALPGNVVKKDILRLTINDIKKYDTIFIYEPIKNKEMAKVFVDNLVKILRVNQRIIYHSAGSMYEHFKDNDQCEIDFANASSSFYIVTKKTNYKTNKTKK